MNSGHMQCVIYSHTQVGDLQASINLLEFQLCLRPVFCHDQLCCDSMLNNRLTVMKYAKKYEDRWSKLLYMYIISAKPQIYLCLCMFKKIRNIHIHKRKGYFSLDLRCTVTDWMCLPNNSYLEFLTSVTLDWDHIWKKVFIKVIKLKQAHWSGP